MTAASAKSHMPVWLLDVDGVINATSRNRPRHVWPKEQWLQFNQPVTLDHDGATSYPILVAEPVLDFIRRVHDLGLAEIRWHTTWRENNSYEALAQSLNLPVFPVAFAPEWDVYVESARIRLTGSQGPGYTAPSQVWWKLGAAERVLHEESRPLLWTDDDFGREFSRHPAVAAVGRHPNSLTVTPDSPLGLIGKHLRAIDEWLDAWASIRARTAVS